MGDDARGVEHGAHTPTTRATCSELRATRDWLNNVDATYRTDLRELNELNFARFDAKLEQRLAEFRVEVHRIQSETRDTMAHLETRLIRWIVGLGVTGFAIMIGLLKLGGR